MLFDPTTSKSRKVGEVSGANFLDDEITLFQRLRHPTAQPLNYWKNEERFLVLKIAAKIVLAVPMSSAAVERVFNAAGLLLSDFRGHMQPALLTNSLYARYGCKIKVAELVRELPTHKPLTPIGEQEVEDFLNGLECAN